MKLSKQLRIISGLISMALSVGCGGGDTIGPKLPKPASDPSSITGIWVVHNQFDQANLNFVLSLTEQADGSISAGFSQGGTNGTFCWEPRMFGGTPTVTGKRKEGSVALILSFPPSADFDALELDIQGTLSDDKQAITGTFSLNGSCGNPTGPTMLTRDRR
jgi:hypothetical protein